VPRQSADVARFDRDDPEALVSAGLAPSGPAVGAGEVISHGLGEVPERLLLHYVAAFGQPSVLGTGFGELDGLREVPWHGAAAGTPPGLLFDGEVPDVPGVRAVPGQDGLLCWRRCQPVAGHESDLVATTDSLEEVKRRFLPV